MFIPEMCRATAEKIHFAPAAARWSSSAGGFRSESFGWKTGAAATAVLKLMGFGASTLSHHLWMRNERGRDFCFKKRLVLYCILDSLNVLCHDLWRLVHARIILQMSTFMSYFLMFHKGKVVYFKGALIVLFFFVHWWYCPYESMH